MKQTEKKEVVNFIQATLADGHPAPRLALN